MSSKTSVGQTMKALRLQHGKRVKDLQAPLNLSVHQYYQMEGGQHELSLLIAIKLCRFYQLSLDAFINLIDPAELERKDLRTLRYEQKRDAAANRKNALETAARMITNGIVTNEDCNE